MKILMVEDDQRLSALIATRLRAAGHEALTAADGRAGLERAISGAFDLAIVDLMLPGMDGIELTSELRRRGDRLPILMLTARDALDDRVTGLRAGADDYLVKPFAFAELLARVDALARRSGPTTTDAITVGDVTLEPAAHRVRAAGSEVELTAKEFDLLHALMRQRGRVVSRAELLEDVWGYTFEAQTKIVDVYVHYVRRKLGTSAGLIQTIRGVGYVVGR